MSSSCQSISKLVSQVERTLGTGCEYIGYLEAWLEPSVREKLNEKNELAALTIASRATVGSVTLFVCKSLEKDAGGLKRLNLRKLICTYNSNCHLFNHVRSNLAFILEGGEESQEQWVRRKTEDFSKRFECLTNDERYKDITTHRHEEIAHAAFRTSIHRERQGENYQPKTTLNQLVDYSKSVAVLAADAISIWQDDTSHGFCANSQIENVREQTLHMLNRLLD